MIVSLRSITSNITCKGILRNPLPLGPPSASHTPVWVPDLPDLRSPEIFFRSILRTILYTVEYRTCKMSHSSLRWL